MKLDMSGPAVWKRLQQVTLLAGSLRPEDRLNTKIDLSAEGVARRLREVSELLQLCNQFRKAGRAYERGTQK
ncbi:MAG: hypothetical protein SGI86_13940 [Deltaproteobacteria bacterium]|nr:hypothetical protein [Deltaproteobacteria bacterium]